MNGRVGSLRRAAASVRRSAAAAGRGRRLAAASAALWAAAAGVSAAAALEIEGAVLAPTIEAEVPALQAGLLAEVPVREGARVAAGEVLVRLDARAAELALAEAEAGRDQSEARVANTLRMEYAQKAIEVARAELRRSQESIAKFPNSISQSQLDVETLTVDKLTLELRQAEHERELERFELRLRQIAVDAARRHLELHEVRAPFAGVVALVRARAGEWVEPGAVVCRLVAVERLRAEGFVDATQLGATREGASVAFRVAGQTRDACRGELRFVSPEIDPVTGQLRVWAEIDNSSGALRPGQRGGLAIAEGP